MFFIKFFNNQICKIFATKIIIPSEIQGLAGLAEGVVQSVSKEPKAEV